MQEQISSRDKDIVPIIKNLLVIFCYMMLRIYRTETGKPILTRHYPQPNTPEFSTEVETFLEDLLDDIFNYSSILDRGDFLNKLTSKQANWLFES